MSVEVVQKYKLLGVYISSDLSWNFYIDYIVKKANKRLYALRPLRKAGVTKVDLVSIYCSLIRSVLESCAPVWAALPVCLQSALEVVQKRALGIIFPHTAYEVALADAGLSPLVDRRTELSTKFITKAKQLEPLRSMIPTRSIVSHGYSSRSGTQ